MCPDSAHSVKDSGCHTSSVREVEHCALYHRVINYQHLNSALQFTQYIHMDFLIVLATIL